MPVRHVLLDADGVLQRVGGDGWRARLERRLGEHTDALIDRLDELETPRLVGAGDLLADLDRVLGELGADVDTEELYAEVWLDVETLAATVEVAGALRAAGVGVHLATNQHARRAAYMQTELGYDRLLGRGFYSCELGLAKPDPAFFTEVARRLEADPAELLLVDDSHDNVAGARAAGLAAEHWHHDLGTEVLRTRLAAHGLTVTPPGTP